MTTARRIRIAGLGEKYAIAAAGSQVAAAESESSAADSATAAAGSAAEALETLTDVNAAGTTQVAAVNAAGASAQTAINDDVTAAQTARTGAEAAEASAQALVLSDLGTTDGQTRALIENPASQTAGALTNAIAAKAPGMTPGPLTGVATAAFTGTQVNAIDYWGGYWWGASDNGKIHRSADGDTWTEVANPGWAPSRLLPTDDGEVLAVTSPTIRKSSGWTANPATATWSTVLTLDGTDAFLRCTFDGSSDGTKFIATGYNGGDWTTSNKVWVSVNGGDSFSVAYNTATEFPTTYDDTHVHSVAYDEWADRFWFSQGHDTMRGLYYSDDDGATWDRVTGTEDIVGGSVFAMVATDAGLVCGTDSIEGTVFAVRRATVPSAMRLEVLARHGEAWNAGTQVIWGHRDSETGIVYLAGDNYADTTGYPLIIWASDGTTAARVWEVDPGASGTWRQVIAHAGKVAAVYALGAVGTQVKGQASPSGGRDLTTNDGNLSGGTVAFPSSVAVGPGSSTTAANATTVGGKVVATGTTDQTLIGYEATGGDYSTAIGSGANAQDQGVAIGEGAVAAGDEAVVIGRGATSAGSSVAVGRLASADASGSVAIGNAAVADTGTGVALGNQAVAGSGALAIGGGATASGDNAVQVGYGSATDTQAVNIGFNSTVSGGFATAIGQGCTVSQWEAVAIGHSAVADNYNSVALGSGANTSANNQVMIGARHLALADVAAADVANGSLFMEGGALKFKGGSGTVTTIAPA